MHDKKCFFGCERFFDCAEGKESEHVNCIRFTPVKGYVEEHEKPKEIDFDKMFGIKVEIEDE